MEQRETFYGHTISDLAESIVSDHVAVTSPLPISAMSAMDYGQPTQAHGSVTTVDSGRCQVKSPGAHSLPILDLQKTLESSQFRHPSMANPVIRRSPPMSEIPPSNAHIQMSQNQGLPSISSFRDSMAANTIQQGVPAFYDFRNPSSGATPYPGSHPVMSVIENPAIKKEISPNVSNAMNLSHHWQPQHMSHQDMVRMPGYPMKPADRQVHSYQDLSGMSQMTRYTVAASNLQNMTPMRLPVIPYSNAENLTHPSLPHVTESLIRPTRESIAETLQHYSNMGSIPIAHSHDPMTGANSVHRDPNIHAASAEVRAGLSEFETHMAKMSQQALQKEGPTSVSDARIAMAHHPQYRGDTAILPDLGNIYQHMVTYGTKHGLTGQQMQQASMMPPHGHIPPHIAARMPPGHRFPGPPVTAHTMCDSRFDDPADVYVPSSMSESESRLQDAISVLSRMSPSVKQEPMDLQTNVPQRSPLQELSDSMTILSRNAMHVKQEPNSTVDHNSLHMNDMNNGMSPLMEHSPVIKQEPMESPGPHPSAIPPLPKVGLADLDSALSPAISSSSHIGESVLAYSQASVGDDPSQRPGHNHERKPPTYSKIHNTSYYNSGLGWQDYQQDIYGLANHRDDTQSPDENVDSQSSPDLTPTKLQHHQHEQSSGALPSFADFCRGMKVMSNTCSSNLTTLTPFHQAFGHMYSVPEQAVYETGHAASPATTPPEPLATLPSPMDKKKAPKRKRSKYLKKQSSDPEEQLPMDVHCSVKINDEIFPCFDETLKTIMTFRMNGTHTTVADQFLSVERMQCEKLMDIGFADPVVHVYNPLTYAFETHLDFVQKYCKTEKPILFLGMNPGPFGMSQNGIPFGEAGLVKSWLAIEGEIYKPAREHPLRPVLGLQCNRSEVSGARFWGLFKKLCGSPENFFQSCFVHNYCPVAFLTKTGRNITPPQLPAAVLNKLNATCDEALVDIMKLLKTKLVVAIGKFVQQRVEIILKRNGIDSIRVETIMHPSPVNPAANKGWEEVVIRQLKKIGVMEYLCLVQPLPPDIVQQSPTDSAPSPFLKSEEHNASSPYVQNEDGIRHSPYSQSETQSVSSPYVLAERQSVPSPYTQHDGRMASSPYAQSEGRTTPRTYVQGEGQSNANLYIHGQSHARLSPYSQSVGSVVTENLINEVDGELVQLGQQLLHSDNNCTETSDKSVPSHPVSVHSEAHSTQTVTACLHLDGQLPHSDILKSKSQHLQSTSMNPEVENFSGTNENRTAPHLESTSSDIPDSGADSQSVQPENHLPAPEITVPC